MFYVLAHLGTVTMFTMLCLIVHFSVFSPRCRPSSVRLYTQVALMAPTCVTVVPVTQTHVPTVAHAMQQVHKPTSVHVLRDTWDQSVKKMWMSVKEVSLLS